MTDASHSRRRFILTAIAASSVVTLPRRWLPVAAAATNTATKADFIFLARLLFPHSGLENDVYAEVAESVFDSFATNSESERLLDLAIAALDGQVDGDWINVDNDRQVAALKSIEAEPFFGAILAALRGAFYNHPKVWANIDYPGSSKEYGGYKHRGFDDIDWLPVVE